MRSGSLHTSLVLAIVLACAGLRADPLSQWTWRYPYPQGSALRGTTYAGGQFVAVGDSGTIITSPDGYNWTVQSFNVFPGLLSVAYASGQYAAVGTGGVILVSSNAVNWTQITSPTTNTLRGIAGDSSWQLDGTMQFMAAGDAGTVVQCTNTSNWSLISSGKTNALYAVTLAPNYSGRPFFSAVGNGGTVFTYSNSYGSILPQSYVGVTNNLYGIAISTNGVAAACGDLNYFVDGEPYSNGILYSLDFGIFWTEQLSLANVWNTSEYFILHATASGPQGFVAVGDTGYILETDHPGVIFTSPTGTSWSETSPYVSDCYLYGATYGNGLYVLVGDVGTIVVSPDLTNFTQIDTYHRSAITAIACSENLCVASAFPMAYLETYSFPDFTTIVSSNAGYWVESTTNFPDPGLAGLTAGSNQFVGVSPSYGVFTTTDGYNWENNNTVSNYLNGVCYANGHFVVVGYDGTIFTSPDGTNWSNHSVATTNSFNGVAYGNGLYVAAGSTAATSSDGTNWSLSSTNLPAVIEWLVHGRNLFVAAGYAGSVYSPTGCILTSSDGVNWQKQFTSTNEGFTGLAYTGGTFLTASTQGHLLQSSDGTNWVALSEPLPAAIYAYSDYYQYGFQWFSPFVVYSYYVTLSAFNGTFMVGGLNGVLLQTGNTWNPASLSPAQISTNGFTFSYNQQIDVPYHVQTSTNLLNWTSVYSGTGTGQPTNFTYLPSNNSPAQFFRLVSP